MTGIFEALGIVIYVVVWKMVTEGMMKVEEWGDSTGLWLSTWRFEVVPTEYKLRISKNVPQMRLY